jgi:hypothetical protein
VKNMSAKNDIGDAGAAAGGGAPAGGDDITTIIHDIRDLKDGREFIEKQGSSALCGM